jgi:SAM-dependent methyltransferase
LFAFWLEERARTKDPYQVARLGEIAGLAQECVLWIEKAAAIADQSFYGTEKQHVERMGECANMMRLGIEPKANRVMQLVTAGVGAHGLLQPHRFERVIRDLMMYLRQPAPDETLAAVGRASLDKVKRRSGGAESGFWSDDQALESLPPHYFQQIYDRERDPWKFETSAYEREKYGITLGNLPRERYQNGLEVGCSIGVLTEQLASRCDRLLGLDVSDRAIEEAQVRCAGLEHVVFEKKQFPDELPEGSFDLVVVSEVAYYWQAADLARAADAISLLQEPGAHLMLVHLTEHVPDYPLTGDFVHEYWLGRAEWRPIKSFRHERFRLDVLERLPTE